MGPLADPKLLKEMLGKVVDTCSTGKAKIVGVHVKIITNAKEDNTNELFLGVCAPQD